MKMPIRFFPLAVSIALASPSVAAVLQQAKITHIVRDVRTVDPGKPPRPAAVGETVQGQRAVRTGIESRTELLFNEQTISRIGANSQFTFAEGTREMTFLRGAMLLQVPKGGGGAVIHTPAVTCAVPGTTILIEAGPGFTKLIVLEGKAILTANADRLHRKTAVTAGQEVIMPNTATTVPPPISVNLSVLAKTSRLVTGTWTAKLDESRITTAITAQAKQTFTETNIAIIGSGTEVVFIPERPDVVVQQQATNPPPPAPAKFGPPPTNPGNFVINSNTVIRTDPVITTGGVSGFGTIYQGRAIDGSATSFVLGSGVTPNAAFDTEFEKLGQTAVFRFESLTLAGTPAIDATNGPTSLALASVGVIASGGAIDFSVLPSVTLAAIGTITLAGPVTATGLQLFGQDILGVAGASIDAVTFSAQTLQAAALSQPGNDAIFNGVPIQSTRLTALDLGGKPLTIAGDILLPAVALGFFGTVNAPANSSITASTLTIDRLTAAGNLKLKSSNGALTLNAITDANVTITMEAPIIDFAQGFTAPALTLNLGSSGNILLGGTVKVQSFRGDAVNAITSATPSATLDAVNVSLFLFGTGRNATLAQTGASSASFRNSASPESLALDLSRTTFIHTLADGNMTLQGNFSVPTALELTAKTGNVASTGSITVPSSLAVTANLGSINFGGNVTAGDINLSAPVAFTGTSIDTTGNLTFGGGGAATFTGNVTANGLVSGASLSGSSLTFGGAANFTGGVTATGNVTAATITGTSISGNNLIFNGPANFTGAVFASNALSAASTLSALSVDAVTVGINTVALNPATLSKTGTSVFFNGVPIKLTRLTSLTLSAPTFNVQNDVALGNSVDVTLTGAITGAGGVTGRNVTFGGPASFTGDVTARGTINGSSISGGNFNFVGPATFSGDVNASGGINAYSTIQAVNISGSSNNDINFLGDATLTGDVTSGGGRIKATGKISAVNISTSGPLQFEGDANFTGNVTTGVNNDMRIQNLTVGGTLTTRLIRPAHGDQPSVVNTLTASSGTVLNIQTGIQFSPLTAGDDIIPSGAALSLTIRSSGNVLFGAGGINEANFNGGSASLGSNNPGGNGGTLQVEAQGDITVNTGPGTGAFGIAATTGANAGTAQTGGKGGTVNLISENGTVAVNALVVVSSNDILPSRVKSSSGGNIKLQSGKPSGTAIAVGVNVTNSADLRALLDAAAPGPGGRIEFIATKGGDILVNRFNGITADRGTIDIRSTGGPAGLVSLDGVRMAADVVKVGALGDNGVLRIGGGSIDAATTMRLYAGGTNGTVNFVDNVTLSGAGTKSIAGRTVNIANGKAVNVTGPAATVFTTVPNYTGSGGNGSTSGQFTGAGATTLPLNHPSKPPF